MQYQVTLTVVDAEDLFDIVKQLDAIKDLKGIKLASAVPRPQQQTQTMISGIPVQRQQQK